MFDKLQFVAQHDKVKLIGHQGTGSVWLWHAHLARVFTDARATFSN